MLLSSHIFAEVERLADRVTIIRDGRRSSRARWPSCDTSPGPRSRRDAGQRGRPA